MGKLRFEITMSADGFITGPDPGYEHPLGVGGERLHQWIFGLRSWRDSHGKPGGETGPDDDLVRESFAANGAIIMGRRMFSGGSGPWEEDPNADAWWGDDPPFHMPVFVLTHHPRETVTKQGDTTFTFVTEGIAAALEQAQAAAGDKDVGIAGGASVAQQYLKAGLLDEMLLHVAPVLMGDGVRLFENHLDDGQLELECTQVIQSPAVNHLRYRIVR
jgi:dihydrofolate reductase